jgi:hypothetical protein
MKNEEDAVDQIFSALENCSENTQREFIKEWKKANA